MRQLNAVTADGYNRRTEALCRILKDLGAAFQLYDDIKAIDIRLLAAKHFPINVYLGKVKNTPTVFRHKRAPDTKYSERIFTYEFGLIELGALNNHHRALNAVATEVEGWRLRTLAAAARPPAA